MKVEEQILDDRLFDNELTPEDFFKFLSEAASLILDALEEEQHILIYCEEGVNRSVACVIAYLILYEEMEYDEAIRTVETCNATRTIAFLKDHGTLIAFSNTH